MFKIGLEGKCSFWSIKSPCWFVSEFWVNINNGLVLLFRRLVVVGSEKDHVQRKLMKRVHV